MKKFKIALLSFAALVGVMTLVPSYEVAAADPKTQIQQGVTDVGGGGQVSLGTRIKNIVNILLYILGAIAVIMIVIGGIRYTTSNGDSGNIKSAKDTILYAVVGLVVALLAYSIINFVLQSF
jgi:multisubunit Na+/H+ antiporter MnhB subunit